ncbi:MAG: hypothetical protein C0446_10670 [Chitinophaga sp.]|jgi:hypothetical protein|nr:hypothetical protein [Chitinophaga sp.]
MFVRCIVRRLSILTGFLLIAFFSDAQNNFLYIQSDNNQPYYIQVKDKIHSSNGKGYLLVPSLADGDYGIILGFPAGAYSEYLFKFSVSGKPKGFSLRINQEGEWMLMDMVSMALIRGESVPQSTAASPTDKQVQKISERTIDSGIEQVFKIKNGNRLENLVIVIPFPKSGSIREATKKNNP